MKSIEELYRSAALPAIITIVILIVPLIAMQLTDEVVWTLTDFIFAGGLIFGTGFAYNLITRKSGNIAYRIGIGVALAGMFLLLWINAAVGIIGKEGNHANLMYLVVPVVGVTGAFISRLRPKGMSYASFSMAACQILIPVIALIVWPPQVMSWGGAGVLRIFLLNGFFAGMFIISAFSFRYVDQNQSMLDEQSKDPA